MLFCGDEVVSIEKHKAFQLVSLNSEIYAVQSCTPPNLVFHPAENLLGITGSLQVYLSEYLETQRVRLCKATR